MPDKALDLLDEACSAVRIEAGSGQEGGKARRDGGAHRGGVAPERVPAKADGGPDGHAGGDGADAVRPRGRPAGRGARRCGRAAARPAWACQHGAPHGTFCSWGPRAWKNSAGPGAGGLLLWQ
ncbi:MAG: hypothetical protein ACLRZH_16870 [Ruthenibacterium lactatiformans]